MYVNDIVYLDKSLHYIHDIIIKILVEMKHKHSVIENITYRESQKT